MLLVRGGDERLYRSFALRVTGDRDDFEIPVLQLFPELLPDRQVKPAASPGGPEEQEDLLAPELGKRVEPAGQVRQHEVRRLAGGETSLPLPAGRAEIPDGVLLVVR